MNIDWQAYRDGLMASAERARVDEMLRSDAAVRADQAAFEQFRASLRSGGLAESLPLCQLHALLPQNTPRTLPRPWGRLAVGAVAASALAFAGYRVATRDPYAVDGWIARGSMSTAQFAQAVPWVSKNAGVDMPVFDLASVRGSLTGVRYGEGWGSYTVTCCGKPYTISFSTEQQPRFLSVPSQDRFHETDRGTGWIQGGLAFYISGPDAQKRRDIANVIHTTFSSGATCSTEEPPLAPHRNPGYNPGR